MTYKKTWLSCLLWAVFTCITGVLLAHYAILFWKKEINDTVSYGAIVFVFLIFAAVAGCYFLIRKVLITVTEKYRVEEHKVFIWEILAVCGFLFVALSYRIYLYSECNIGEIAITEYYRRATVNIGGQVEPLVHGASYLYTVCLSFILSFFGNKVVAAVWVQILIQMLTILLAYFTVKKMAGSIPACMTMFVLSISSVYTKQIFTMTPECFMFMLYMAGMFVIGSYVRKYCSNRFRTVTMILGAIFSGIVIGALTYLDALSVTLFVFFIALFTGVRETDDGAEKCESEISVAGESRTADSRTKIPAVGVSILVFLLTMITGIVTVAGIFALDAYVSGTKIEKAAGAWLNLYLNHLSINYEVYRIDDSVTGCLILVALAALLVMAFWVRKKVQNATPWICLMLLLSPTPLAASGVLAYQVYAVFLWSILAGIGVQQSFVSEMASAVSEIADSEQAMQNTLIPMPVVKPVMDTPVPAPVVKSVMQDTSIPAPASKPRFIENPLPVPKRHERREMDYQYEVAADKMKFDVDVRDDDDFDIL